jgi:hypothetical protein
MTRNTALTPELLEATLENWDTLAFFAYDQFVRSGRGAVGLERLDSDDGVESPVRALYAVFPPSTDQPDRATARILADYDPDQEFVVMYEQSIGGLRTMRLRTAPGARAAKRVWCFEMLRRLSDASEPVPDYLPDWFLDLAE